jgi:hypothetical protein
MQKVDGGFRPADQELGGLVQQSRDGCSGSMVEGGAYSQRRSSRRRSRRMSNTKSMFIQCLLSPWPLKREICCNNQAILFLMA